MNSLLILVLLQFGYAAGQEQTTQPLATSEDCICNQSDPVCSHTFRIEHRLTMVLYEERKLVYPDQGILKTHPDGRNLTQEQINKVITADGQGSRLVIAINGKFPGPRIEVYEKQILQITVQNMLHTESVTVHFHGLHQTGTPWMDGVAFVTQCPILPGQSFVYRFTAFPPGTAFYHAHIGDQRSMGLYGPLIVRPVTTPVVRNDNEIIVTLQDWNNVMDSETAYQRMITEQFNLISGQTIPTTYSVDLGQFSRFEFHSGLVNGKGRFWSTKNSHNGAPLEQFSIRAGIMYRFRVIGAMTLYPMRVHIPGQRLFLRGSDAFNLEQISVQSIIVHPGERYDFYWQACSETITKQALLIAETIETQASLNSDKYHAAEAILVYVDEPGTIDVNPVNNQIEDCRINCKTFNCPYAYYPTTSNRKCLNFNDVKNNDPVRHTSSIMGDTVDAEYFFNFAFPGPEGNTPGSVNGREFVPPTVSLLTQPTEITSPCDEDLCINNGICKCTYVQNIDSDIVIQMVFMNLGTGSGWSHPVHFHGHSFYVMKVGLGTYNNATGVLISNNDDINCTDKFGYCSTANWTKPSWNLGKVPGLSDDPPQKDTVVVPTGGYVVIRFVSDNPGMWFLHCHIDLHNTNGMGMMINEGRSKPATPVNFPICRSFLYDEDKLTTSSSNKVLWPVVGTLAFLFILAGVVVVVVIKKRKPMKAKESNQTSVPYNCLDAGKEQNDECDEEHAYGNMENEVNEGEDIAEAGATNDLVPKIATCKSAEFLDTQQAPKDAQRELE